MDKLHDQACRRYLAEAIRLMAYQDLRGECSRLGGVYQSSQHCQLDVYQMLVVAHSARCEARSMRHGMWLMCLFAQIHNYLQGVVGGYHDGCELSHIPIYWSSAYRGWKVCVEQG